MLRPSIPESIEQGSESPSNYHDATAENRQLVYRGGARFAKNDRVADEKRREAGQRRSCIVNPQRSHIDCVRFICEIS